MTSIYHPVKKVLVDDQCIYHPVKKAFLVGDVFCVRGFI